MLGNHDDILDSAYIKEKISDVEARKLIEHIIKTKQIPEINVNNLNEIIDKIKQIKNISKGQILRVLEVKRTRYYKKLRKN